MSDVVQKRRSGRPRSEAARETVLAAALELARENSVQTITIEAIAKSAGVSKATIYRWWNSKASVVIDAFVENHIVRTPMPRDCHPAEALVHHWRLLAEQYSGWPGNLVAQILAEGQSDPEVLREFRERFHYGRRAVVREVVDDLFQKWRPSGDMSVEEFMDLFYAPLYMRLSWRHRPVDADFIANFPINFFRLLGLEMDEAGRLAA
ncbi:TetR/AcrR family transcriptional regulator [Salipiger sp. IMCC34102]|uniref:TetR/AcrR family transcriptional regulator n=1 Tax=Salipiger sp. IMCC34102 TaxID=2510647 RepID=UPI00101DD883|nr:TetR/AcrR family transcriptional regulator [Salipiger sp. IMCC34102]RYH01233.1 TetR/AcrR family transcriptional regulator [Salipiger sp. IMCC34102]